jgi:hypothetical protein
LAWHKVQPDGRFRVELAPPGARYFLVARSVDADGAAVKETPIVAPGAVVDLGDVPFSAMPPQASQRD